MAATVSDNYPFVNNYEPNETNNNQAVGIKSINHEDQVVQKRIKKIEWFWYVFVVFRELCYLGMESSYSGWTSNKYDPYYVGLPEYDGNGTSEGC